MLERDVRFPARDFPEFRAIGQQDGNVRRPEPLGILFDPDLDPGQREKEVEDLLDRVGDF